jgi:hypothetical protein
VIDEVRMAFTALRAQEPPRGQDLSVLPIASAATVFVGIDDQSRQHFLLPTDADNPPVTEVATLTVTTRNLIISGVQTQVLDVICLLPSLAEVFDYFVVAIIERVSTTGENAGEAIEAVLQHWRQFLIATSGPPGRDKLAALLGELLVVTDAVSASGKAGVGFWVGPAGARHDIRSGATAVEVKTTRAHTDYRVTIHGEDQLMAPQEGTLYLHLIRLEAVHGGGQSVASVVDGLLASGVSAEELFESLTAAGLNIADLAATADVTFEVRERVTLPVDDRTPRIVPATFIGGKRPVGVLDMSYVIDVAGLLDCALSAEAYRDLMRTIGSGAAV